MKIIEVGPHHSDEGADSPVRLFAYALLSWAMTAWFWVSMELMTSAQFGAVFHALATGLICAVVAVLYFRPASSLPSLVAALVFAGTANVLDLLIAYPILNGDFVVPPITREAWIPYGVAIAVTAVVGMLHKGIPTFRRVAPGTRREVRAA